MNLGATCGMVVLVRELHLGKDLRFKPSLRARSFLGMSASSDYHALRICFNQLIL
jgi:hypothetical protein